MVARKIPNDERALAFINDYTLTHGYPPSLRDLCEEWDVAIGAVQPMVMRWRRMGLLRNVPRGTARSVVLSEHGMKLIGGTAQL